MHQFKISIATPSFNQGKYIQKAITSVQEQRYKPFEHIIFDNCSTDETREIARQYSHVQFFSEPDEGQSDALNKGFQTATGDIIGWLNADDYYLPGTFEKVNEAFNRYDVDAIYSNVKFVNQNGDFIRNMKTHSPVKWMSLFYTFIQSTTFFFRREIIQDNHLLDKNLHYCMDMEFFARLLHDDYKFRHINDYFACFRWHDFNKSSPTKETLKKNIEEGFYIINKTKTTDLKMSPVNIVLYKLAINLLARPVRRTMVLLQL